MMFKELRQELDKMDKKNPDVKKAMVHLETARSFYDKAKAEEERKNAAST